MSEKIYCGSAKEIQTKYGPMMKLSLSSSDIEKMQANLDNGWVNVKLLEKREKVEGKPTHYLEVDTWKPDPNQRREPQPEVDGNSDLPF